MTALKKSELMARLRKQRAEMGIRQYQFWLTIEQKNKVDIFIKNELIAPVEKIK